MMWKEFEELAGYEVTYDTYSKVIEPMYMALPDNVTKLEFVKMLDKKAFALPTKSEMVRKMKFTAQNNLPYTIRLAGYETEKSKLPKDLTDQEYAEKIRELANKWRV